ncbi:hypothetical protein [Bacteriovorax sp. DB6_IX]|uniref:hypothetical protein n=1 Tax=Bacteriovorax sp. DB6_IX TaxID=1353530 RepID=UPI000389EE49|nr:hypothetical protein [Bacteriovorax sp. DB6_IX]EQC52195.1 hypothetical protein M901_2576 [Bacteriovorax sp. DB6_IX]
MKSIFGLFLTLFMCLNVQGAQSTVFSYNGESQLEFLQEEVREVTLYRDEVRDSTCTRRIPYTVNECGYETRYRQQCTFKPGYNNCYNDTQRDCNYETRYRRVCSRAPGRQVCEMKPGKTTCRTNRQGERRCHTTSPRRVCRDVPGRETCRQEPYRDYVCHNRTVRRCDWVPGRNVCTDEPYQEYVCKDVTKYRTENYACKITVPVPYKVEKNHTNKLFVKFSGDFDVAEAQFNAIFKDNNGVELKTTNLNEDELIITSNVKTVKEEDYNYITNIDINFFNKVKELMPVRAKSHGLWMNKGGEFVMTLDNFELADDVHMDIHVRRDNGDTHFRKSFRLTEFKKTIVGDKMKLSMDLGSKGFKRLKALFGTGIKLKVDSTIKLLKFRNLNIKEEKTHSFKIKVYKNKTN